MPKRRKRTPEEIAEQEAQKERTRRFSVLLERRLKLDEQLAAERGPDEQGPPRLPPRPAEELATEEARNERTRYFKELMAWRQKRDEELASSRQDEP